jgi:hypothetical protein
MFTSIENRPDYLSQDRHAPRLRYLLACASIFFLISTIVSSVAEPIVTIRIFSGSEVQLISAEFGSILVRVDSWSPSLDAWHPRQPVYSTIRDGTLTNLHIIDDSNVDSSQTWHYCFFYGSNCSKMAKVVQRQWNLFMPLVLPILSLICLAPTAWIYFRTRRRRSK